ncbi:IS3 family transposase [Fusobacterium sp. PH5-29]|uniref:IS3 family transposase n=1 Tax=Fusobacterium sp. PH5-29 TaxID=1742400 RepID=UPI003D216DD4
MKTLCRVCKVSCSGYYKHLSTTPARISKNNEEEKLIAKMKKIHKNSDKAYGAIRINLGLKEKGINISIKRTGQLMKKYDIKASSQKKFKPQNLKCDNPAERNLIKEITPTAPNQIWVSDITYIDVIGYKPMYLSAIMDLYSRKIIAHVFDDNMRATLVEETLKIAISRRKPDGKNLIFHSDKGSQYRSTLVKNLLKSNNIQQSMCGTGNCYENAAMESFNSTLKKEALYPKKVGDAKTTKRRIFNFIEGFYNKERYHSSLGYLSPEKYELAYYKKS